MEIENEYEYETSNPFINLKTNQNDTPYNSFFANDENKRSTYENTYLGDVEIKPIPKFSYKPRTKPIIQSNEIRLKKDIEELKKNSEIEKVCQIRINEYIKMQGTDNLRMIVEFVDYFSVEFLFTSNYPFEPPIISYYSGNKIPLIFDSDGKLILEKAKAQNWRPTIWLSGIIKEIEELIFKCPYSFIPVKMKYTKRKWDDYIKEEKSLLYDKHIINDLIKNIKVYKNYNNSYLIN